MLAHRGPDDQGAVIGPCTGQPSAQRYRHRRRRGATNGSQLERLLDYLQW
jgi:hypothetical protein